MKFITAVSVLACSSLFVTTSLSLKKNAHSKVISNHNYFAEHDSPLNPNSLNNSMTRSTNSRLLSNSPQSSFSWIQKGSSIYGKENARDWFGNVVSTSEDGLTVAIGAVYDGDHSDGNYSGYVQVVAFDSNTNSWNQVGQIIDTKDINGYIGWSISLSANAKVLAVSVLNREYSDHKGYVQVFRFISKKNLWKQMGEDIQGEAIGDNSGVSVSLSANGKIVAIGAPDNQGKNGEYSGHIRVHRFLNSTWAQVGQDIDGENRFDWSGVSVSLSHDGHTVAVGAKGNDGNGDKAGHIRVFTLDRRVDFWNQIGKDVDGFSAGDFSGYSLSLSADGQTVAVGAPYNDGEGISAGHVRVYHYESQKCADDLSFQFPVNSQFGGQELVSCNYIHEDGITDEQLVKRYNRFCTDEFNQNYSANCPFTCGLCEAEGSCTDNPFTTLMVFVPGGGTVPAKCDYIKEDGITEDQLTNRYIRWCTDAFGSNKSNSCRLSCGKCDSGAFVEKWVQIGNDIDGEEAYDEAGWSISLSSDGNTIAIGSPNDYYGNSAGYTRVFQFDKIVGSWEQIGQNICGEANYDYSGWSVSLSGDGQTIVIGDAEHDANGVRDSGQVRVFHLNSTKDDILCGTDANALEGQTIYYSAVEPIEKVHKCFRIEVFEGGVFDADSSDPKCKNTENFNSSEVYSSFKKSKGSKFIMRTGNDDLGYDGVFLLRQKAKLVNSVQGKVIVMNNETKTFSAIIKLPFCAD